jgi:mRNA interferase RelE/StbE
MIVRLYQLRFEPAAARFLGKLCDKKLYRRLRETAESLRADPRPYNCKRLQGTLHAYLCVRVGDYRIVYRIIDRELVVVVVDIDDRKDIYR